MGGPFRNNAAFVGGVFYFIFWRSLAEDVACRNYCDAEPDGESRIIEEKGALYLDVAAIVWEQFVLALPPNPLCRPDCKGLCPECGANLNEGMCACSRDEGDPRMAVLRGLKIRKQ